MLRRKKPAKKKPTINEITGDKKKIQKIINNLSNGWNPEERETAILFDHHEKVVHLETSYGPTARRWFENMWGDPNVEFDGKADTLKLVVPWEYCRKPDLIVKAKYRKFGG